MVFKFFRHQKMKDSSLGEGEFVPASSRAGGHGAGSLGTALRRQSIQGDQTAGVRRAHSRKQRAAEREKVRGLQNGPLEDLAGQCMNVRKLLKWDGNYQEDSLGAALGHTGGRERCLLLPTRQGKPMVRRHWAENSGGPCIGVGE